MKHKINITFHCLTVQKLQVCMIIRKCVEAALDAELESLELDLTVEDAEEEAFEASAEAVIANAEELDTLTEEA